MAKPDYENTEEGISPIYVGNKYLFQVHEQMNLIRESQRRALSEKGDTTLLWLNELITFFDLIENRTGLRFDKTDAQVLVFRFKESKWCRVLLKVAVKEKYDIWFKEIEKLIEKNLAVQLSSENRKLKYNNDKRILIVLSHCTRELYRDANRNGLIMPPGMKNMKDLAKEEWIDRPEIKDLYSN